MVILDPAAAATSCDGCIGGGAAADVRVMTLGADVTRGTTHRTKHKTFKKSRKYKKKKAFEESYQSNIGI